MRIMGIDPGLARCGWAVIEKSAHNMDEYVSAGVIETSLDADLEERIIFLKASLQILVRNWKPKKIAVERFSHIRSSSASAKLGMAYASIICAIKDEKIEILPQMLPQKWRSKLGVQMNATKDDIIAHVIRHLDGSEELLSIPRAKINHASDACAIAMTGEL